MTIRRAETDAEIMSCYPVMRELRPHLGRNLFLARIRRQEQSGYILVYVEDKAVAVAAAGYRITENLAWGRFLYVDDLVSRSGQRSLGYGAALLAWLKERAEEEGCDQLHLDSGVQRKDAHRFYDREGMDLSSYHFRIIIRARPEPARSPGP